MIRPFTIAGSDSTGSTTYHFYNHRNDRVGKSRKKIHKDFFTKIFSHPITAFGFRVRDVDRDLLPNPKFDRTDVLRALDFWIEYFVHQNKIDYLLDGTVNKEFELTIREFVETREAVLKEKADTKFVRARFGDKETGHFNFELSGWRYRLQNNKVETNMSESEIEYCSQRYGIKFPKPKKFFKDNKKYVETAVDMVNFKQGVSWSSDQFCYKVVTKEVRKSDTTPILRGGPYSGIGWSTSAMMAEMAARSLADRAIIRNGLFSNDDHRWLPVLDHMTHDSELAGHVVTGPSLPTTNDLTRITDNSDEIDRWRNTGRFLLRNGVNLQPGDRMSLTDAGDNSVLAQGRVGEAMAGGDLVMIDARGLWVKVPLGQDTTYENMRVSTMNNGGATLHVELLSNDTTLEMEIPIGVTLTFVDHINRSNTHQVRLTSSREQVMVDGQTFPITSLQIRQGSSAHVESIFRGGPRPLQVFLHPRDQLANIFGHMAVTESSMTLSAGTISQTLTFFNGSRTFVRMTTVNQPLDINGFKEIRFPGGGMVNINGENYSVPNDSVEVITR